MHAKNVTEEWMEMIESGLLPTRMERNARLM